MVNENNGRKERFRPDSDNPIKSEILTSLVQAGPEQVTSGVELSRELGVSRVAVWKHIKTLQELGYPIESGPKGYRLLHQPDLLFPWELSSSGAHIHYYPTIGSTMTTAKTEAEAGAPDNTVILAETQAAGRGRKQRSWASEAGGLYATLVLRPDLPLSYCHLFNFAAAISLAHVLQESYQLSARVKWPNDVLVEGKKVAGILLEASGEPHSLSFLTVGMGINVNNDPRPANPEATSLRLLLGRPVSRSDLFSRVYTRFRSYIEHPDDSILSAWKAKSHTLGRRVCIRETDHTLTGTALDIQRDGALLVEKDPRPGEQKIVIPVYSGDIEEIR